MSNGERARCEFMAQIKETKEAEQGETDSSGRDSVGEAGAEAEPDQVHATGIKNTGEEVGSGCWARGPNKEDGEVYDEGRRGEGRRQLGKSKGR